MSDRSVIDHPHSGDAEQREGRHNRRTFVAHAATGAAAAAAAVGIAVAVDDDAPERLRLTILPGAGLVHDVRTYGAQGDGQTDDAAAIQKTINAAKTHGGTVYFPVGTYAVHSTLTWSEKWGTGINFVGAGSARGRAAPTTLLYKGATGSLLQLHSVQSWLLQDLCFGYDNPSFTGDLIDVDGVEAAVIGWKISRCSSYVPAGSTRTARSIIRLNRAIVGSIVDCAIADAGRNGIRVGDPGGGVVNDVQIEKCTFNYNMAGHILLGTADGENLVIRDCTFENPVTPIKGGRDSAGNIVNQVYSPVIENCSLNDTNNEPVGFIDGLRTPAMAFPGTIRNCTSEQPATGKHLNIGGQWTVQDCTFAGGIVYTSFNLASLALTALGNCYILSDRTAESIMGSPFNSAHPWPTSYVSLGNRLRTPGRTPTPHPHNVAAAANRITALQT